MISFSIQQTAPKKFCFVSILLTNRKPFHFFLYFMYILLCLIFFLQLRFSFLFTFNCDLTFLFCWKKTCDNDFMSRTEIIEQYGKIQSLFCWMLFLGEGSVWSSINCSMRVFKYNVGSWWLWEFINEQKCNFFRLYQGQGQFSKKEFNFLGKNLNFLDKQWNCLNKRNKKNELFHAYRKKTKEKNWKNNDAEETNRKVFNF